MGQSNENWYTFLVPVPFERLEVSTPSLRFRFQSYLRFYVEFSNIRRSVVRFLKSHTVNESGYVA
jgi:hypothetical protein